MKRVFVFFAFAVLLLGFISADYGTGSSRAEVMSTDVSVNAETSANVSSDSNSQSDDSIRTREEVKADIDVYKARQEELRKQKAIAVRDFRETRLGIMEKRIELRERLQEKGEYMFKLQGRNVTARQLTDSEKEIIVDRINLKTGLDLTIEDLDNKTELRTKLSNGNNASVKILPIVASARAQEIMRAKCAERNCTFELKEVSAGGKTRLAYEIATDKDSRLFFLFKKRVPVVAKVDAETGEIVGVKKPWWAFLAKEKNDNVDASELEANAGASAEIEATLDSDASAG